MRKVARAFTEQGVAKLAGVLRSARAVAVSIAIVRAFVRLRELLAGHRRLAAKVAELEQKVGGHDAAIAAKMSATVHCQLAIAYWLLAIAGGARPAR